MTGPQVIGFDIADIFGGRNPQQTPPTKTPLVDAQIFMLRELYDRYAPAAIGNCAFDVGDLVVPAAGGTITKYDRNAVSIVLEVLDDPIVLYPQAEMHEQSYGARMDMRIATMVVNQRTGEVAYAPYMVESWMYIRYDETAINTEHQNDLPVNVDQVNL